MSSLMTTLQRGTGRVAESLVLLFVRVMVVVFVAMAMQVLGNALGVPGYAGSTAPVPTTTQAPSAEGPAEGAPAPAACELAPKGLFNPCATLDMHTIDDLRDGVEGKCIAADGVMTPEGTCVDAIAVWKSEVPRDVWTALRDAGYPRCIDASSPGHTALRVPAEFVILGGENGEAVLAVDMTRPVTPRLI